MSKEYKVKAFLPTIKGCGAQDKGWNDERCQQFELFLNENTTEGWILHSYEYRSVSMQSGCGSDNGSWLVCVFEKLAS